MRPTGAKRLIATTLAVLALLTSLLWLSEPANAQDYGGACTLAGTYDDAANTLHVTGSGFAASVTVSVLVDGSSVGSTTTSAGGAVDATFNVDLAAGSHTVTADCDGDGGATVQGQTTVSAGETASTAPAGSAPLARTGQDSVPLAAIALVLVAVGGVLVLFARHRRHQRLA